MGCDGKDFILSALFPVGLLLQNSPDGLFEDGAGLIELEGYGSEGHEQEYVCLHRIGQPGMAIFKM